MSLISGETAFQFPQPAVMQVIRNNGHCYGRIIAGEKVYHVYVAKDWYDQDDEEAVQAFIRASRDPKKVVEQP